MGGFACNNYCLPNAGPTASTCSPMLTFNHLSGVQIHCLGYLSSLVDDNNLKKNLDYDLLDIINEMNRALGYLCAHIG